VVPTGARTAMRLSLATRPSLRRAPLRRAASASGGSHADNNVVSARATTDHANAAALPASARSSARSCPTRALPRVAEVLPGLSAALGAQTLFAVHTLAGGADMTTMVAGPGVTTGPATPTGALGDRGLGSATTTAPSGASLEKVSLCIARSALCSAGPLPRFSHRPLSLSFRRLPDATVRLSDRQSSARTPASRMPGTDRFRLFSSANSFCTTLVLSDSIR
jgi:hypothetical protein